jgi:hypothetical protein
MSKFARYCSRLVLFGQIVLFCGLASAAKKKTAPVPDDEGWKSDPKFDLVIDKIAARESLAVKSLGEYSPMVETYIQNMRPDKDLGRVPVSDEYFLGRINLEHGVEDVNFLPEQQKTEESNLHKIFVSMHISRSPKHNAKAPVVGGYMSEGFAQMVIIDMSTFDRKHYDFRFVKREFLGDVRTLVIDVKPKEPHTKAMFIGRIWAEDQQFNVVRFNGTYTPQPKKGVYMHFDSWRENMGSDQWLPVYVYSEETDLVRGDEHWDFRGQTLLWGYDALRPNKNGEFTDIVVDTPEKVNDRSNSKQDLTTVEARRAWQRQAEENVLDRMQRAALLAPEGAVDTVLNTVVQNIEVTNNLTVEPEITCRVLLTQPFESVTIGHTIVVSRGLLDALPDEASLAAVLAHEMGHILSGHDSSEKYAFSDRMIFPDSSTISSLQLSRTPDEEKEADAKAVQLLQNSPYKDKLSSAGLFFSAMQADAPQLPYLLKAQFGNSLHTSESEVRLSALVSSAPELQVKDVKQIAALPLGGRIKLNAWSDQLTIQKTPSVRLISASEKMPFQITPMFPYLTRQGQAAVSTQPTGKTVPDAEPPTPSAEAKPTVIPTPPPR